MQDILGIFFLLCCMSVALLDFFNTAACTCCIFLLSGFTILQFYFPLSKLRIRSYHDVSIGIS